MLESLLARLVEVLTVSRVWIKPLLLDILPSAVALFVLVHTVSRKLNLCQFKYLICMAYLANVYYCCSTSDRYTTIGLYHKMRLAVRIADNQPIRSVKKLSDHSYCNEFTIRRQVSPFQISFYNIACNRRRRVSDVECIRMVLYAFNCTMYL